MKLRRVIAGMLTVCAVCILAGCGPEVPAILTPQSLSPTPSSTASATPSTLVTPTVALTPVATPTPIPTPTYFVDNEEAEPPADYAGLIKRFTDEDKDAVVVMGKFIKFEREDNANRTYEDMSKPDPNYWNGVKVFTFAIESTFKGSIKSKTIEIALPYRDENLAAKTASVKNPNYMEPVIGDTYIIPLLYDKDLKWYINDMGIEPMWFKVTDDKLVYESVKADVKKKWDTVDPISVAAFKKLF